VYALVRREGVPWPQATASVALDKLFELVGNFGVLVLALVGVGQGVLGPLLPRWVLGAATGLWLVAGLALLVLCQSRGDWPAWLPQGRWAEAWTRFARAARAGCPRASVGGVALALTGLTWLVLIWEYGWMARAVGLAGGGTEVLSLMLAARLAFLVPVPGGMAALEAGQYWAARALGYDPARGLALAVLIRARDLSVGLVGVALARTLMPRASGWHASRAPHEPARSA